jgi:hypothetical protein
MLEPKRDRQAEAESLAAFGIEAGPAPEEEFHIWPENWSAVGAFASMLTQWNVGMAGPVGLRYESLPVVLRMIDVAEDEWRVIFSAIRVMEGEALRIFAERRGNG